MNRASSIRKTGGTKKVHPGKHCVITGPAGCNKRSFFIVGFVTASCHKQKGGYIGWGRKEEKLDVEPAALRMV